MQTESFSEGDSCHYPLPGGGRGGKFEHRILVFFLRKEAKMFGSDIIFQSSALLIYSLLCV